MPAQDLGRVANELRAEVLRMVHRAGAGHVAGPLSAAEIITSLYFGGSAELGRDKIILSCGHYVPIQYAALSRAGYLPKEELLTFMQAGGRLPGHPERLVTPGIEVSAGPLGQGVSVGVGMALGMKMKRSEGRVFVILSDGELQEGQVWEAFNLAGRRQLDNLTLILDQNRIQIGHYVSEVATYGEIEGRLEAFGLYTQTINGNLVTEVGQAITKAKARQGAPTIIVCKTIAGKGVSFMENDPGWHDRAMSAEELELGLRELEESNE